MAKQQTQTPKPVRVLNAVAGDLSPRDRKRISNACDTVVGGKNEDQSIRAYRWATKAFKQIKGMRKHPMRLGEDGLTNKQRASILAELGIKPEVVAQHYSRLGFTK